MVAKLNDDIVMRSDLDDMRATLKRRHPADTIRTSDVLSELFDRTLLLEVAKEGKMEITQTELNGHVEQTVAEMRAAFPSEAEFVKSLQQMGLTLPRLKQDLARDGANDFKVYRAVTGRFLITDADVARFEASEKAAGRPPEQIELRRLGVRVNGAGAAAESKAIAKARAVLDRINSEGLAFTEGIRRYSELPGAAVDGGELGLLDAGQLSETVRKALAGLGPGQVSKPVIVGGFASVFYVESRRGARAVLFERRYKEERERLLGEMRRHCVLQLFDASLQSQLPAAYAHRVVAGPPPAATPVSALVPASAAKPPAGKTGDKQSPSKPKPSNAKR